MSSVTGSSVRSGKRPEESETTRLQREVDHYTQKFENEKRKLQIIEDQIKQIEIEFGEKKENIQKVTPKLRPYQIQNAPLQPGKGEEIGQIRLDSQKHAIKKEQLSLNSTKSQNKEYKREIDMLRREIMYKNNETKRLTKLTKKMHQKAEQENGQAVHTMQLAEQQINQAIALRAKHEEDKDHFEAEIKRY